MRQLAENELLGAFMSCFDLDSKKYSPSALEVILTQSGNRLEVLAAAAVANITFFDDDLPPRSNQKQQGPRVGENSETTNSLRAFSVARPNMKQILVSASWL